MSSSWKASAQFQPSRAYRLQEEAFKSQWELNRKARAEPLQKLFPKRRRQILHHKWTFLLLLQPHAGTHMVVILPEQIQVQLHKHNNYKENVLRLHKKPIDIGRVLGGYRFYSRTKTRVHQVYLFLWWHKAMWARETVMVIEIPSHSIQSKPSYVELCCAPPPARNTSILPANTILSNTRG